MHQWGDEDFDWKALDGAINIIYKTMNFFRIGCHIKEKYGTIRTSVYFWDGDLHSLIYPGYVYSQFPSWLWKVDIRYIKKISCFLKLYIPIHWIQRKGYTLAYYLAMRKYPHIKEEICCDADAPELIIGGAEIHNKHWSNPIESSPWWKIILR